MKSRLALGAICVLWTLSLNGYGQSVYRETGAKAAVGVKFSTLGAGAEIATPLTRRSNIRFGFNAFSYSRGLDKDHIHYDADMQFRSIEAHYDFFPFAGRFHISPGILAYLINPITAHSTVPGGQNFTLGGTSFVSDPTNPVNGTGKLEFNRVGPSFTVGWGNLLP